MPLTLDLEYTPVCPQPGVPFSEPSFQRRSVTATLERAELGVVLVDLWNIGFDDGPLDVALGADGSTEFGLSHALRKRHLIEQVIALTVDTLRAAGVLIVHGNHASILERYPQWAESTTSEERRRFAALLAALHDAPPVAPPARAAWPPADWAAVWHAQHQRLVYDPDWQQRHGRAIYPQLDIPAPVQPAAGDLVVADDVQLHRLLHERQVRVLCFMGFETAHCVQHSPYGMAAMKRRGYGCRRSCACSCTRQHEHSARPRATICMRPVLALTRSVAPPLYNQSPPALAVRRPRSLATHEDRMPSPPIPVHISRFCEHCGAAVELTAHPDGRAGDQHHVSWVCSRCGHAGGATWVTFHAAHSRLGRVTARLQQYLASLRLRLPTASRSDRLEREQAVRQIEHHGSAALLRLVEFPLVVLAEAGPRLRLRGPSFGWNGLPVRGRRRSPFRLSLVGATYVGPDYEQATECLELSLADSAQRPHEPTLPWSLAAQRSLAGVSREGEPRLQALVAGGELYRWINLATLEQVPLSRVVIPLVSGDAVHWEVGYLTQPAPMAMARAHYERTHVTVAAAGGAAQELEAWLARLDRLRPMSRTAAEFDAGVRAADAYFKQRYAMRA